jgi:hypothetical protein
MRQTSLDTSTDCVLVMMRRIGNHRRREAFVHAQTGDSIPAEN